MPNKLTIPQVKAISVTCTTISAGSAIATPFLVTKANKEASAILESRGMLHAPLKERAKATWKAYILVGGVMTLGLGASGIHGILTHKVSSALVSEIAAHAMTVASNNEVKEALLRGVKEKYGLDVEQAIRDQGAQAITDQKVALPGPLNQEFPKVMTVSTSAVQLCDDVSGRHFIGSIEDVKAAVNSANACINAGQEMSLADIYEDLGLDAGSVAQSLTPKEGELFELTWSYSGYKGDPCAHFGFRELVVSKY